MSLDEDLSPLVRHRMEQDDAAERDWLEQRSIADWEESGGAWQARHDRQQAEQPAFHYTDRADRRLFSVEGELAETARRDAEEHDLPGWVA
jgi:hypothetical protein